MFEMILLGFHVLFFYKIYKNPFLISTSELFEIHWGYWRWLGRNINPFVKDNIYYKYPFAIPFLSTFYPWHYLSSILSRFLSVNNSFRLLSLGFMAHYFLSSILAFKMFCQWYPPEIALFGAVTLPYMAYAMRLDTSAVYTLSWIPGMFVEGWIGSFSFGMALLSGYYPILVYMAPLAIFNNPPCLVGLFIGVIQVVPFLWYYPKSVRWNQEFDQNFGKLRVRNLLDLVTQTNVIPKNGLLPFEYFMTLGVIPLMLATFSTSRMGAVVAICLLGMLGIMRTPFRIPARLIYPFCFGIVWMACNGVQNLWMDKIYVLALVLLQGLIYKNNERLCMFPFTQWARRPDEFIRDYVRGSFRFPFSTGYYFNERTPGYKGAFSLRAKDG